MDCAECSRLKAEKDRLRHAWADAISDLSLAIGTPANVYDQLMKLADDARREWQEAVFELHGHTRSHATFRTSGAAQ
jgi:hypothetical protein